MTGFESRLGTPPRASFTNSEKLVLGSLVIINRNFEVCSVRVMHLVVSNTRKVFADICGQLKRSELEKKRGKDQSSKQSNTLAVDVLAGLLEENEVRYPRKRPWRWPLSENYHETRVGQSMPGTALLPRYPAGSGLRKSLLKNPVWGKVKSGNFSLLGKIE